MVEPFDESIINIFRDAEDKLVDTDVLNKIIKEAYFYHSSTVFNGRGVNPGSEEHLFNIFEIYYPTNDYTYPKD